MRHAVKLKINQPQPVIHKVFSKYGRVFVVVENNEQVLIKNLNQLNRLYESSIIQPKQHHDVLTNDVVQHKQQLDDVITNEVVLGRQTRSKSTVTK